LLAVTWFLDFFQIFKKHTKLDAGGHVRADFHVNRSGDSLELSASGKKRKKSKAAEKYNLTVALQNGNIIIAKTKEAWCRVGFDRQPKGAYPIKILFDPIGPRDAEIVGHFFMYVCYMHINKSISL